MIRKLSVLAVGTVGQQLILAVLLPYIALSFSAEQFAVIGIFSLGTGFLTPVLALGLNSAVERFYFEWAEQERESKIFSILLIQWTILLLITGSYIAFAPGLDSTDDSHGDLRSVLACAGLYSGLTCMQYIPITLLRLTGQIKRLSVKLVLSATLLTSSVIFYMEFLDHSVNGFIKGQLLGAVLVFCIWTVTLAPSLAGRPVCIREELKFALKVPPAAVLQKGGEQIDRWLALSYLSATLFGAYALVGQALNYITTAASIFKTVFVPRFFQLTIQGGVPVSQGLQPAVWFLILYSVGLYLLSFLASRWGVGLLDESYEPISDFLFLCIFGPAIAATGFFYGLNIEVQKRTGINVYSALAGVVLGISFGFWLVPAFGIYGAALTYLISMGGKSLVRLIFAFRMEANRVRFRSIIHLVWIITTLAIVRGVAQHNELRVFEEFTLALLAMVFYYAVILKPNLTYFVGNT